MVKQKGFSLVEGLLIILILAVVGFAGYYVWSQQDKKTEQENNTSSTPETTQEEVINNEPSNTDVVEENQGVQKTINGFGESFTFSLPDAWSMEEKDGSDYGEYDVFIRDPNSKYLLTLKIFSASTSGDAQTAETRSFGSSFIGVNGKQNFIENTSETEPSLAPALHISACGDRFCFSEFKDEDTSDPFENFLGVYITRNENDGVMPSEFNMTPIDPDDETLKQILNLISTIKLAS